ncbi:hypothetical protein MGWOODY_Clf2863 [hydrothermal vent metagenome]|uniref:Uncharacterized protein n=1 Tax=hydrothermal vent metagenome TaxID=652676 RepID=A0A160V946_9ZZZZ
MHRKAGAFTTPISSRATHHRATRCVCPGGQLFYGEMEFRVRFVEELAFGPVHIVFGDVPDKSGPLLELSQHVLGRFVASPTSLVSRTAPGGESRESDRIGVADGGVNIHDRDAQYFSHMHGHGGPATGQVRRTFNQADRPVLVQVQHRGRWSGYVGAHRSGHPSTPIWDVEWRLIMRVVLGRLQSLQETYSAEILTRDSSSTLFRSVQQSELHRIHGQFLTQFVDQGLSSESGGRASRCPVGRALGFVDDHVVGFHPYILDVVRAEHCRNRQVYRSAWKRASLVHHRCFRGGDAAVLGCANLGVDVGSRGRTSPFKFLGTGQGYLDGASRFFGK